MGFRLFSSGDKSSSLSSTANYTTTTTKNLGMQDAQGNIMVEGGAGAINVLDAGAVQGALGVAGDVSLAGLTLAGGMSRDVIDASRGMSRDVIDASRDLSARSLDLATAVHRDAMTALERGNDANLAALGAGFQRATGVVSETLQKATLDSGERVQATAQQMVWALALAALGIFYFAHRRAS